MIGSMGSLAWLASVGLLLWYSWSHCLHSAALSPSQYLRDRARFAARNPSPAMAVSTMLPFVGAWFPRQWYGRVFAVLFTGFQSGYLYVSYYWQHLLFANRLHWSVPFAQCALGFTALFVACAIWLKERPRLRLRQSSFTIFSRYAFVSFFFCRAGKTSLPRVSRVIGEGRLFLRGAVGCKGMANTMFTAIENADGRSTPPSRLAWGGGRLLLRISIGCKGTKAGLGPAGLCLRCLE